MKLLITLTEGGEVREASDMNEAVEIMTKWAKELGGTPDFRCTRADVVCDFCSESGIVALYQITPGTPRSIEVHGDAVITHMDEDGLWGACATCNEIIESIRKGTMRAGSILPNIVRLRDRAVERFMASEEGSHVPRELVEFSVAMGHNFFLTHWDGEPSKPLMTDEQLLGN
jgi:hypothetical protein